MVKQDLEQYKDIKQDLFFWMKMYLAERAILSYDNKKHKKIPDILKSSNKIKESETIDELKKNGNSLHYEGLSVMARLVGGLAKFYPFVISKVDTLKAIDDDLLEDFKDNIGVGKSTAKGYLDAVIELLNFISNCNAENFKYKINIDEIKIPKTRGRLPDPMDEIEFSKYSKMLLKYEFKTEYERARGIFLCRLLMFSGITATESTKLQLNKNFFIDDNEMYIDFKDDRKAIIELPRNLLITFFNKYKKLSLEVKNRDIENDVLFDIGKKQIDNIVVETLEFADIKRYPMSAMLLRISFAVWVYNNRTGNQQISIETLKEILGLKNKSDVERMIGLHDKKFAKAGLLFKEDLFI